jgi:hypothetical protein
VRFTEINLFGVYVAPISLMMVAAWMVTIALQRSAARFGLLRHVWHRAIFVFPVYMIVLSTNRADSRCTLRSRWLMSMSKHGAKRRMRALQSLGPPSRCRLASRPGDVRGSSRS